MIHWKRFLWVLLVFSLAAIVLIRYADARPLQAAKFQEDMAKGETALNTRKYEAAVDAFKDAVRDSRLLSGSASDLSKAQANLGLSRAYLGLGAFKNAIESCDEALKYTGASRAMEAMVHNQRGLALVASLKPGDSRLQVAIDEFRAVLEIADQDPMVSYNLGVTLLKLDRDAEGIHELQAFVARGGNRPEVEIARRMIDQPRRARENFAPDFSLTTLAGEYVTLNDLKGKVVLLDFWGTWCPPCRESTPSLVRYSRKHPEESFVMIAVAVNEASENGWRDYIEKNKMVWPQYLDSTRKLANLFKVTAFPTYIIIDADGVVRDRRTGWNTETMDSIDNQVKRAIKARTSSPRPMELLSRNAVPAAPSTAAGVNALPAPAPPPPLAINPAVAAAANGNAVDNNPPMLFAVRGRVIRPAGQVAAGVQQVTLTSVGNPPLPTPIRVDGSFEFMNIRSGVYTLYVPAPVPPRPIIVSTGDLNGIEISLPATKLVNGRFSIEGIGAAPRFIFRLTGGEGISTVSAIARADGGFTVTLPEGERGVVLTAPGYLVKSLTYGSTDLLQNSIISISGSSVAELRVTLLIDPSSTGAVGAGGVGIGGPAGPNSGALPAARGAQGPATLVTTAPQLISSVQAQYTDEARQARVQGAVSLQLVVRTDGTAGSVTVLRGLGFGLDEAATQAVRQFRFRPATRNGVPVETVISVDVRFNLQ